MTKATAQTWSPLRASASSRRLIAKADPSDLPRVQSLEHALLKDVSDTNSIPSTKSVRLLIDLVKFYENIGEFERPIVLLDSILGLAKRTGDTFLERRSNNVLGVFYARVSDFNLAFAHIDAAIHLAEKNEDTYALLATLSNAAIVLYEAGLVKEAKTVAMNASLFPSKNPKSRYLHLINSNNGIRFSHDTYDQDAADYFFSRSTKLFNKDDNTITEVTRAYYEAYTSEHLTARGKIHLAISNLQNALKRTNGCSNIRVLAILNCALGNAYLSIGDEEALTECESRLHTFLPLTMGLTCDHERLLRLLIKIAEQRNSADDFKDINFHSNCLKQFLISTKHKQFFEAVARSYATDPNHRSHMEKPTEPPPLWMRRISSVPIKLSGQAYAWRNPVEVPDDQLAPPEWKMGRENRTTEFEVAEDWAVAAELLTGGNWQHCFAVGQLVNLMARQCEVGECKAKEMGLAARLHDLGKIAVVEKCYLQVGAVPLNSAASLRLHSEVGGVLLSDSTDVVLKIGALMAANHHEYWNGGGSPNGRSGEVIPFEARLCAVADVFVSLRQPREGGRWSTAMAANQVESMAGVQLDPNLVSILLKIVRASGYAEDQYTIQESASQNKLLNSKKDLFRSLELVD